jgi:cysteine desulfurase/selenocysteine lyase
MSNPAKSSQPFDVEKVRADFTVLHQEVNGKPLIYLDSAATAQKPEAVLQAMTSYYHRDNANVHRGAHTLGDRATASFEGARDKVQQFLNAESRKQIIWTKGTTEAINLIANGYSQKLNAGDEIIVTRMEHHANIVPWQMLCERTGAILRVLDIDSSGALIVSQLDDLLSSKTRIFACTHVSNVLGTVNPIKAMIEKARAFDVVTVIDGAQATPHFQVDVQDLDCDFYTFSSHKVFGPTGIGALYGKKHLLEELPPYQGGGEMIERVSFEGTTYNALPYKFEAGTPAIAEAVGLGAAIDYLNAMDRSGADQHERSLLALANELSKTVPGMSVIGTSQDKVPVMSFKIEGLHPSDIGMLLDQQGIGIRTGHHCAMPLMEHLGLPGSARASFAFYNTHSEVEQLFAALRKIQKMLA